MSVNVKELAGTILVVDDEPGIRHFLSRVLRVTNARVEVASDGKEALEHIANNGNFTLAILDLSLPDMSGLELARVIRADHPSLPVILSSGYEASAIPPDLRDDRYTEYLHKPYQIKTFWEVVQRVLSVDDSKG